MAVLGLMGFVCVKCSIHGTAEARERERERGRERGRENMRERDRERRESEFHNNMYDFKRSQFFTKRREISVGRDIKRLDT